jgi:hypothetical protein
MKREESCLARESKDMFKGPSDGSTLSQFMNIGFYPTVCFDLKLQKLINCTPCRELLELLK